MSSVFQPYDPRRFRLNLNPDELYGPPLAQDLAARPQNQTADIYGPNSVVAPVAAGASAGGAASFDEPPPAYPQELLKPPRKMGFIDAGSALGHRTYEMDIARERKPLMDKYNADFAAWKLRQDARRQPRHDFRPVDYTDPQGKGTRGVMDLYAPNPNVIPIGGIPPRQDTTMTEWEYAEKHPEEYQKLQGQRHPPRSRSWADLAAEDPELFKKTYGAVGGRGGMSATQFVAGLYEQVYGPHEGKRRYLEDQRIGKIGQIEAQIMRAATRPNIEDPYGAPIFDPQLANSLREYFIPKIQNEGAAAPRPGMGDLQSRERTATPAPPRGKTLTNFHVNPKTGERIGWDGTAWVPAPR